MKKTRIAKLEKQQVATTSLELELTLCFGTEEERLAAEQKHAQYEPGPVKYVFKLQEDSANGNT